MNYSEQKQFMIERIKERLDEITPKDISDFNMNLGRMLDDYNIYLVDSSELHLAEFGTEKIIFID